MTFGARADEPETDWRGVAWLLVATTGLTLCLTWLFLGMRSVMDIGGACADGGPYVPVQSCPAGVPVFMTLGVLGLFGFGGLGMWAGARVGGAWAGLPLLAWPGLFLSLGWNFLEYGVAPPPELAPEGGPIWGWLVPGVIFVLMGGVPLWFTWTARSSIRREGSGGVARRFGVPDFGAVPAGAVSGRAESTGRAASPGRAGSAGRKSSGQGATATAATTAPPTTASSSATPRVDGEATEDVVDRLERLADLRRRGDLTSEEFEAFKRRLLEVEGR